MSDSRGTENTADSKNEDGKTEIIGGEEKPAMVFPMKTYKNVVMYDNEIEEIEKMDTRVDDVWVCSFPRSGTTLTQEIAYLVKTGDFETATSVLLDDRFPVIDVIDDRFPYYRGLQHTNKTESPRFIKTHFHHFLLPEQLRNGKGKIIYTTRNPKDSIMSLYKLLRWFRQFDDLENPFETFFELFMKGEGMYAGPWWTHVKGYWDHRDDENVLFMKYEDTVKDMPAAIRKVANFLGRDISEDLVARIADHCSLEKMRNNKMLNLDYQRVIRGVDDSVGGFINKGIVGGWKEMFTDEMCRRVDEMFKREFDGTGLSFD